jgi:DtxR family transcriptional regulator, Mn-dependent transcriptional regulator
VPSSTVENYVKQLYLMQQSAQGGQEGHGGPRQSVAMGRLAAAMGVVPGTATSMVKALSDSGLVAYEPRTGVRLSAGGERLALHVLRRHRLIELFLVKVLGLDWSEVHDEAEELEHAISEKVLNRIDEFLGHPSADPHGDPIPTSHGQVRAVARHSLADCPLGEKVTVARVVDQSPEFLQFIDRCGLNPGVAVVVEHRDPHADSVRVKPNDRRPLTLGSAAAAKVLAD